MICSRYDSLSDVKYQNSKRSAVTKQCSGHDKTQQLLAQKAQLMDFHLELLVNSLTSRIRNDRYARMFCVTNPS